MKRITILSIAISSLILLGCKSQKIENKQPLVVSDGSLFIAKDIYPQFSWSTTPMYYMFGAMDRVLSPGEVEFIAKRTDFLCIEKSHGFKELGAAELGAKHEAAALKKIKPDYEGSFLF